MVKYVVPPYSPHVSFPSSAVVVCEVVADVVADVVAVVVCDEVAVVVCDEVAVVVGVVILQSSNVPSWNDSNAALISSSASSHPLATLSSPPGEHATSTDWLPRV